MRFYKKMQSQTCEKLSPRERLIVAVDVEDAARALALASQLKGHAGVLKIGLELFCAEGPQIVRQLADQGRKIFLDLKLHDIPNTVGKAVSRCAGLGVSFLTIHTSGGLVMMREAVRAAQDSGICLLGVSVLTSLDPEGLHQVGVPSSPRDQVLKLASLAQQAGLGGLVCSPQEVAAVRAQAGGYLRLVTPGIRPAGADKGDQSRIATPASALADGSDYLVVGRPITAAASPSKAASQIVEEMQTVA